MTPSEAISKIRTQQADHLYDARGLQFPGMLLPGSVVVLYMDDGPSGPCGQSSFTMCNHSGLLFFKNEERMREHFDALKPRQGLRAKLRYWVVGSHGDGVLSVSTDKELAP